jgi:hypothetical protein
MLVNVVQGLVVQGVGQFSVDGLQALVHTGVRLIPILGPYVLDPILKLIL